MEKINSFFDKTLSNDYVKMVVILIFILYSNYLQSTSVSLENRYVLFLIVFFGLLLFTKRLDVSLVAFFIYIILYYINYTEPFADTKTKIICDQSDKGCLINNIREDLQKNKTKLDQFNTDINSLLLSSELSSDDINLLQKIKDYINNPNSIIDIITDANNYEKIPSISDNCNKLLGSFNKKKNNTMSMIFNILIGRIPATYTKTKPPKPPKLINEEKCDLPIK
jgi:hypothetical protein